MMRLVFILVIGSTLQHDSTDASQAAAAHAAVHQH